MNKKKLLNVCLILTSFIGYLEWGKNRSMFLIQGEFEIFYKLFTDPTSILHPLIILPLAGQVLLFITLFQNEPKRILTFLAIGFISILFLLIFFIGIIDPNYKILLSSLPFLILSSFTIVTLRKNRPAYND